MNRLFAMNRMTAGITRRLAIENAWALKLQPGARGAFGHPGRRRLRRCRLSAQRAKLSRATSRAGLVSSADAGGPKTYGPDVAARFAS